MQVKNKLIMMVGNTYMYKTRIHKIIATKIKESTAFISTNIDLIELNIDEAEQIIRDEFLPVDNMDESNNSALTVYAKIDESSLITDLMNNIEIIKKNPGFINQAKAINNTVNTILNIAKTELQIKKLK